jgi:GDPmannose 4,6-dehydratase
MDIEWRNDGIDEVGIDRKTDKQVVAVDPSYFRPTEVDALLGDPSKAKRELGWEAKTTFAELVQEMTAADHEQAKRDALVKNAGYQTFDFHE